MKDIVVTKEQIIKALKAEPLKQGRWILEDGLTAINNCQVCAVGAVLRHLNLPNNEVSEIAIDLDRYKHSPDNEPEEYTREQYLAHHVPALFTDDTQWLSAISGIFESASSASEGKKDVIDFVKKYVTRPLIIPGDKLKEARDSARRSVYNLATDQGLTPPNTRELMTDKEWEKLYSDYAKKVLRYKGRSRKFKQPKNPTRKAKAVRTRKAKK